MQQMIKVRIANKIAMDTITITSLFFLKNYPAVAVSGRAELVLSLVLSGGGVIGDGFGYGVGTYGFGGVGLMSGVGVGRGGFTGLAGS
jgi:hypothetical protein